MTSRGLVVGADIVFSRTSGECGTGEYHDEFENNIRRWALFWDRLAMIENANVIKRDELDLDFLESTGFLTRYNVNHNGGQISHTVHDIHLTAMDYFEKEEPGLWAIDSSLGSIHALHRFFPDGDLIDKRGAIVQLNNVIPVPNKDVPLADILEFKEKRDAELKALRHYIDDLYLQIGNADDTAFALNSNKSKVEQASNDVVKAIREKRLPFRLTSEFASINLLAAGIAGAAGVLAHSSLTGILGNIITSSITVQLGAKWARRNSVGTPFEYVAIYHDELFLE